MMKHAQKLKALYQIWLFAKTNKRWWLLPMMIIMVIFGFLLVFAQSSALAPFIYTLF